MRTAVSTMRVSRRLSSFLRFKPNLLVVTDVFCFVFFSPSSRCSFCQAHHVCVRTPTIIPVQTPWCFDIHSLFPVPPKEAGERKRTMRCQFLNPLILFFFWFLQMVLYFLPSSSSTSGSSPHVHLNRPLSHWLFLPHLFLFFLNHQFLFFFLQWNSDILLCHMA